MVMHDTDLSQFPRHVHVPINCWDPAFKSDGGFKCISCFKRGVPAFDQHSKSVQETTAEY